jgi:PAS domain S-box-containing protein
MKDSRPRARRFRMPYEWPLPAQYAFAFTMVALSLIARAALGGVLEDRIPFLLTFGVLLPLVLLVRPGPLLVAAMLGGAGVLYLFVPTQTFDLAGPAEQAMMIMFAGAITLTLAATWLSWRARDAHERDRRRIAASEQRYRTLFNSIDEGFCVFDVLFDEQDRPVDYRWLETNPAFERHTGLSNVVGRTARELVPTLEQRWLDICGAVALTGKPARFEGYSGRLHKWFSTEAFRVASGKRRVALLFSDITESKRTEEALRSSEGRLRFTLEAARFGTWALDLSSTGVRAASGSPRHDEIFGYVDEHPDWSYETFLHHVLEEDRPKLEQSFQQAQSTGREWEFECRIRRKDGEIRWIWARGQAIFDSTGRAQQMLGLVADVTERKEAESALREGERRLRLVTDAAPALISYVDSELRYQFTNKGYTDWFDWRPEDLRGRHLSEVLGEQAFEAIKPYMAAALAGNAVQFETRVPYKHGGTRFVRAHYVPDVRADGSVGGYYALIHDVTVTKQAEQALRDADRRKDEFLATLAHELRNPLAAVRMALGVMDRTADDPELAREMKAIIDRQSSQLSALVDDLTDMSRISRGKIELRRRRLEAGEVIRHLVDDARPLYEVNGVELSLHLPEELVEVHADPSRFSQVINNVLQNARKFTPRGGHVRVSLAREDGDAVVRVADNGIGLSPAQLSQVFEMFAQVESPLTRKAGGLGIGLSLARSIIELHGGSIQAASEGPGQGSEFLIRMAALPSEPAVRSSSGAGEIERDPGRVGTGIPRRILAADDNSDALGAVAALLRMKGHEVDTASDGIEALEKARRRPPEVALLDIGMPGLDGYELARQIRSETWGCNILLVAMTGWGQARDKARAREAGFDEHMTKPIDPAALDRLLAVGSDPTSAGTAGG